MQPTTLNFNTNYDDAYDVRNHAPSQIRAIAYLFDSLNSARFHVGGNDKLDDDATYLLCSLLYDIADGLNNFTKN